MARHVSITPWTSLRVVTHRIAHTPTWQLPQVTPYLADIISTSAAVLASPENQGLTKYGSEAALLVHKFKTQVTSILQDKNHQTRWTAVVLIKATVEAGGYEILRGARGWVKGLLETLSRPEPSSTKKICIITLTKIFVLTHEHQSLVRDITTTSLPAFIQSCLKLANETSKGIVSWVTSVSSILTTVLEAFCELLPYHPSIFRPFVGQLRELLRYLLAPTPSNINSEGNTEVDEKTISEATASSARRLLVVLCSCAPKNTSSQEWVQSLQKVGDQCHRTADLVFRAMIEDLAPSRAIQAENAQRKSFDAMLNEPREDLLDLPSWTGIHGGIERLHGQIKTLQAFLTTTTPSSVAFPLEKVADVAKRVLSILPPGDVQDQMNSSNRINPEVDREEREALLVALPRLHVSAINLIMSLLMRFERGLAASINEILGRILRTFCAQRDHDNVRRATYDVLSLYLSSFGPTTPRALASMISNCVESACEDLLPSNAVNQEIAQNGSEAARQPGENGGPSKSGNSYIRSTGQITTFPVTFTQTKAAARTLICSALRDLPNDFLLPNARNQVDVASILVDDNEELMEASIMNPTSQTQDEEQRTILPFLARKFARCERVEALTRPRMPSLQLRPLDNIIPIHSQYVLEKNVSSTGVPVVVDAAIYSKETVPPRSSEKPQLSDPLLEPNTRNQVYEKRAESTSPPTVPSKRSHEPVTSPVDKPPAPGDAPSSTEEHRSKRLHLARDGVYDPPLGAQSLTTKLVEPHEPSQLKKLSPPEETLPDLKAMDEIRSDDDSDDSAIPPIDLEMPSDEDSEGIDGDEEDEKSQFGSKELT